MDVALVSFIVLQCNKCCLISIARFAATAPYISGMQVNHVVAPATFAREHQLMFVVEHSFIHSTVAISVVMDFTPVYLQGQFVVKVKMELLLGLEILAVEMFLLMSMVARHVYVMHYMTGNHFLCICFIRWFSII